MNYVTKDYENRVLNELDLDIQDVHALGIIGESGCGKSTLLRLMAAIEDVTSGELFINDKKIVAGDKQYQDHIGVVFQKHNLFPHLTLRENIMLILRKIKGMDADAARNKTTALLAQLRLTEQADKRPGKVSGGQAQRASIARALSTDPDILFLDEPTAALDPILTEEVLSSVKELKESGRDFVFVTHEIKFLREFADYVIFMQNGRIAAHGTAAEVFSDAAPQILKDFIN
jgi:polar amino acid transport system ATP-binding protein